MEVFDTNKSTSPISDEQCLALYKEVFPAVARYIGKMGGTLNEAKDVFQDALIIYYEQVLRAAVHIKRSEKAYIFGVSRYLWYQKQKREDNNSYRPIDDRLEEVSDGAYEEISEKRLLILLSKAGDRCMQLLTAFYYHKLSMKTLAEKFGFASERSATVQKFKCLGKIRDFVKEKALQYEDFI
ncbi:sigma-70 family RNA polymerase sigma factor [Olivibacter sp. SDN3]|uniref:RNA polymerase sigma factor n=1 Tax=Olivibacter sp. SDN3 TaxID=2764720 RepID=UPI001651A3F3|nr:sigma-70 family RNA polymerase sigma factor [Olivibacter sp. SDN3]QNL49313.1 sigma-70 family RNA polymerase sigma factor [Olivibacter sp. SDN3]